ncbi:MAG: sugar phosphate isomerase/epimerase [Sphingobacteriaceae bacterium]|nr:MAG: sugar phosphate isomerase/epimerase [Sphingobacteriaceae bacterium]
MKIDFFCPRWGFEHVAWNTFLCRVKAAGYVGVEWFPYSERVDFIEVLHQLKILDLKLCIVMTVVKQNLTFEDYLQQLKTDLLDFCQLNPLFITAQTGREYFNPKQIEQCLACCAEVSQRTGIPIYQETHRNKWGFAAHQVYPVLQNNPDFMLTLDVSHWFCVSESYLEDQQEAVNLAIHRTKHIHARIGHTQSSQVADPKAPEHNQALQEHLKIWDRYVALQRANGTGVITITPEFGPPPYLTVIDENLPADEAQWRFNLWMKDLLFTRYNLNEYV